MEATYAGMPDNAALRDELRFGSYSDAAEREQVRRLINSTPHATATTEAGKAAMAALASITLDLTPIVGDVKGFMEAESPFDYVLQLLGALGPAGDLAKVLVKDAKAAMEAGDIAKASEKLAEFGKQASKAVGDMRRVQ